MSNHHEACFAAVPAIALLVAGVLVPLPSPAQEATAAEPGATVLEEVTVTARKTAGWPLS
jgi:hypothetical protein